MSSVLLDLTADRLPAEARVLVESRPLPPDVVFHPVLTGMASGLWTWVGLPAAALLVVGGVVHLVTRIRVGAHLAGAGELEGGQEQSQEAQSPEGACDREFHRQPDAPNETSRA